MKQTGDSFAAVKPHIHAPTPGGAVAAKIEKEVKEKAKENLFTSAPKLTEEAIKKHLPLDKPCEALKPLDYYARNANNVRKKVRPTDVVGYDFELDETHFPEGFLRGDLKVSCYF